MFRIFRDRYSPPALFMVTAIFVLLAPVFFLRVELTPAAAASSPYLSQHLYENSLAAFSYGFGRLRAGEIPLWNPFQYCGLPFQANPASGIFQPLNLLFLLLPADRALAATSFACLVLMGAGCALFLRSLELRYLACIFGGTVYAFSGASAAVATRPELAAVMAWAPLQFWAVRELHREFRAPVMIGGAVAAAGCWLSGGYGISLAFLLVWLPYALLGCGRKQVFNGRRPLQCAAYVGGLVVLGAGLSAVQWLPALRWAASLAHPEEVWRLEIQALFPESLRGLLGQWLTGRDDLAPKAGYVALGALLAAPGAFFVRRARVEALYFGCGAVLSGAAALLPAPLLGMIPQSVWWFPFAFCVAVLAGVGADRLFTVSRDPFSPFSWLPVALMLLAAGFILYAGAAATRGILLAYLLLLLPFLLIRARPVATPTALVACLLLFIDCCLSNVNLQRHPLTGGPAVPQDAGQMLRQAEEQAVQGRVMYWSGTRAPALPANFGMIAGVALAGGAQQALDAPQADWWERLSLARPEEGNERLTPSLLNFMAARVFIVDEEAAFGAGGLTRGGVRLELLRARGKLRLYRNEAALPRALWAPQWYPANGVSATRDALTGPSLDPATTCIIDAPGERLPALEALVPRAAQTAPGAAAAPANSPASARIISDRPERVSVQVEAAGAGMLVLADSFHEDWRVLVDDQPQPVYRANGLFRGVAIPAGAHLVVFEYRPQAFWMGLWVSLGTCALLAMGGLVRLFR